MPNLAGIDIGNDSIKIVLENHHEPIIIPNIIAPGYERHILQEEDSPIKALDVVVNSPSLQKKNQRYFVGYLAVEDADNFELEETDNKAESEQSLIVTLTALAYAGVTNRQNSSSYERMNDLEFIIGTGLPVRTYAKFNKTLRERLIGEHEITFLTTPELYNRTVKLVIKDALVSIEGAAALFNMSTHENLAIKDDRLYSGTIGICEIGALTTDFPVIKRMNIDNRFSYGEQIGMANYLDSIIREVEDQYNYTFPSRAKLVQRIKQKNYLIQNIGEGQSNIKPIVDEYFTRAAQRMLDLIKKRWKKYPDIESFYVLGGGAIALQPYITEAAGPITLRFVEESELQNVYGYLKLARKKSYAHNSI